MGTFRIRDNRMSSERAREVIAEGCRDRALGYCEGGFDRVCASIIDPVEQFRFVASVQDARSLFEAVKIISSKDSELRIAARRRRH